MCVNGQLSSGHVILFSAHLSFFKAFQDSLEATTPNANPLKCGDTIQSGNLRDFLIHFDKVT